MKKFIYGFMMLFLLVGLSANASEPDDLLIQVDLDDTPHPGCSILQVKKDGSLSISVTGQSIVDATGLAGCDFSNTGMAAGLDGLIYFSEDTSDNIMVATSAGAVGVVVTDTIVEMIPGLTDNVDWENGMAINPITGNVVAEDEGNDAIIEIPTNVTFPITNPDLLTVLADRADFEALIGMGNVNLRAGIAIDDLQNIYIANDNGDTNDVIFKLTEQGNLSILCTEADLQAAFGIGPDIDLDVGMAINGSLYVADDGSCDCIIEVDPVSCDPEVLVTENQIESVTGNTNSDLEGGLCIDSDMNLFLGDDGSNPPDDDRPNIIKIPANAPVNLSLFAGTDDIRAIYPGEDPRLRGACTVKIIGVQVPTLSEWGLIGMAAVLGIAGFIVARRRMINA